MTTTFVAGHAHHAHSRLRELWSLPFPLHVSQTQRGTMNVLCSPCCWKGVRISTLPRTSSNARLLTSFRLPLRSFQHLASKDEPKPSSQAPKNIVASAPPRPAGNPEDAVHISLSQQRKNDWQIIKRLSRNLWPKDDWSTKARVVVGMGLLVAGKVRDTFRRNKFVEVHGSVGLECPSPTTLQEYYRCFEHSHH